ncbi:MAG: hypothetical protein V4543_14200 [Bacteroidota bacterium]
MADIAPDANPGLQSRQYGWLSAEPENLLLKQAKQFRRKYWPVVLVW